jgi:anthranilate/para-aminobenzoate synthase component I
VSPLARDAPYWERACRFFDGTGLADDAGSYFVHHQREHVVRVGVGNHRRIALQGGAVHQVDGGAPPDVQAPAADSAALKRIEERLDPHAPCCFVVSPDFRRPYADETLPQMLFLQPAIELIFSPDAVDGRIGFAADAVAERTGSRLLREAAERAASPRSTLPDEPRSFPEIAEGWVPVEPDESFVGRLDRAARLLVDHPEGKMTLTRAFERRRSTRRSPFALYELHAGSNGEYAYSHFVCLRDGVFSVGCTPENVFEIHGRTLSVDVVASTCRADEDPELELLGSARQVKEHRGSLDHREGRYRMFCTPGSFRVASEMEVIRLRHVCHLHSVIRAQLLPGVTMFDVLGNVFPLIGARPKELLPFADSEPAPHRFYGGVVGHVDDDAGGCFLNLRNVLIKHDVLHAKVGVGIIGESIAEDELVESREKISGIMEAVHIWDGGRHA